MDLKVRKKLCDDKTEGNMKYLKLLLLVSIAGLFTITCMKDHVDPDNNTGTVTDADGNVYATVKIGNQVWMRENLRVTKYNDGSAIPFDTSTKSWNNATTPKYCYYKNTTNPDSIRKYGALYNGYVVSPANLKKIAPMGWHVPSDSEWIVLEKYLVLNGFNWDGTKDTAQNNKIAKSLAAKTFWYTDSTLPIGTISCNLTKNNNSGFSALPGGCFSCEYGMFVNKGCNVGWWSATEYNASSAFYRYLYCTVDYLAKGSCPKSCGFSIRLVKD